MTTPGLPTQLGRMFTLSEAQSCAVHVLHGRLHLKAAVRAGKQMLLVWPDQGRAPGSRELEELGEDAGFFDPLVRPWPIPASKQAVVITEGFRGQTCHHEWGMLTHFDARSSYGASCTCQRCRVSLTWEARRRGQQTTWLYDGCWVLRGHIWQRWAELGPASGELGPQAHH
ncbi:hypothetical protein ACINK0_18765 (plasmid) [Deinococcus sp. VB343]|uniref:Uncharacterized protein n=1 Tax=Deinococcus sp. VB142 TaxID=3112952 RepID=A0AAU6Q6V5_9DEIO